MSVVDGPMIDEPAGSRPSTRAGSARLPDDRIDAVVVGAGVVGLCVARYLQLTGRRVVLVERDHPGSGASGHNAGVMSFAGVVPTAMPGILAAVPGMLRDPLSPLAIRWAAVPRLAPWLARFVLASRPGRVESISQALHALMEPALPAYRVLIDTSSELSGDDRIRLRPGGLLYASQTEASFRGGAAGRALRRRRGIAFEVLDDAGIARVDPLLGGRFQRAVHVPGVLHTHDPLGFTAGLARSVEADGGRLVRAAAIEVETERGLARAVITDRGRIGTDLVVVAAGAWSTRLGRGLGLRVPLDSERGYGVHLPRSGVDLRVPILSDDHHVAIVPAGPGALRLAGTDELAGIDAPPNLERADRLVTAARTIFPELRADGAIRWMGHRPSMPDSLPVIGRSPRVANVLAAFGHGHVGLTLAAITGRLIAELADGRTSSIDLAPYRPTRFHGF